MNRPGWPGARHAESDTGEALQTDVMRFVAILALCLVAIFALVQTLPLPSVAEQPAQPQPAPVPDQPSEPRTEPPAVVAVPDHVVTRRTPDPAQPVVPEQTATNAIVKPIPFKVERPSAPGPERILRDPPRAKPAIAQQPVAGQLAAPRPAKRDQPLRLRFTDDEALLALLAKGQVALYAQSGDTTWQVRYRQGRFQPTAAAAPRRFHIMNATTVPQAINDALQAMVDDQSANIDWMVTLPDRLVRTITGLAQQRPHGTLLIHADERVTHVSAD